MTEDLDFSLPNREQEANQPQSKLLIVLVLMVLIAVLANLGVLFLQQESPGKRPAGAKLSDEQSKQLALKLEKQGLTLSSADAWKAYLQSASLRDPEAARIWYRIGKLYQQENQYDNALEAYYRSESFAALEDVSMEIARRTQECLEKMGKFAALRYELADRVGTGSTENHARSKEAGNPVVAEIGAQKIYQSDLDRRIERLIEIQLSRLAAVLSEEQAQQQKETVLKQYATDNQRRRFLNQTITEEVLYRHARESGLSQETDVRAAIMDMERSLLAQKALEKEFSEQIKITSNDLETYFKANQQAYVQPERARISHILVADKKQALNVRNSLKAGADFAELAAKMSLDAATRIKGGELSEWIEKGGSDAIPGMGKAENAANVIFSTDAGRVAGEDIETENGIHIIKVLERETERQKSFDEVKNEMFITLRSEKEQEAQKNLFARLKEKYDVVVHHSALSGKSEKESQP